MEAPTVVKYICGPDTIEEEMTYPDFLKWKESLAQIIRMGAKPKKEQVATFWTYCSSNFLAKVQHLLKIESDMELLLPEVMQMIEAGLKSKQNLALERLSPLKRRRDAKESLSKLNISLQELAKGEELSKNEQ